MRSIAWRSLVTLGGWLLAALLWCGELPTLDLVEPATAPVAGSPPSPPSAAAAPVALPGAGLAERTRWMLRVAELEGELVASEQRLAAATADTDRYRRGLERAVGELNRRQRQAASPPAVATAAPGRRATPTPKVTATAVVAAAPLVQAAELTVIGDQIIVHGSLRNPDRDSRVGTLRVELLHDGRVVDVRRSFLEIEPRGEADYRHRFRYTLLAGTLSARAVFGS